MAHHKWAPIIITLGLITMLSFIIQVKGTLACKEESSNQHQSVSVPSKMRSSKFNPNAYTVNSVQRSHRFISPIVSRWEPSRTVSMSSHAYQPAESTRQERIVIPIGVSHYRPVQYVDSFPSEPFPSAYFDKVMASASSKKSTVSTTTESSKNSTVAASSDINEVKVSGNVNPSETTTHQPGQAHPPRFIELESSYVPLTIRFPSRATKLNIIPGDGNDLVGQDSNQHNSFGKRVTPDNDDKSRSLNLDTRTIFGETKREEPLVLKEGAKSTIPNNMQRIIKCIFPDFHFDGEDQVQSAC